MGDRASMHPEQTPLARRKSDKSVGLLGRRTTRGPLALESMLTLKGHQWCRTKLLGARLSRLLKRPIPELRQRLARERRETGATMRPRIPWTRRPNDKTPRNQSERREAKQLSLYSVDWDRRAVAFCTVVL